MSWTGDHHPDRFPGRERFRHIFGAGNGTAWGGLVQDNRDQLEQMHLPVGPGWRPCPCGGLTGT